MPLSKKLSEAFSGKFGFLFKLAHPIQTIKAALGGPKPKLWVAIENLKKTVENVEKTMADPRTELVLVVNPEKLSVFEGKQLREAAEAHKIIVKRAVINKMLLPCGCKFCSMKRKEQEENLAIIKKEFSDLKLIQMPYLPYEVLSLGRVREYAKKLFAE